ncbi:MAG: hypothetical protein GVY33_00010 [Alphaproteobacteria bacterium]|nr:hypothetical protein [Alphaproteobacteria bacterium]
MLRESRHPSNKPITDEQLDRAMAETTRVWGPARQSDGSTAIVPHPVDKVADRLAPARGMSPDWVYEQVFEANRDALTSRDSVTYVDDELNFNEFRRMVEDGEVELRATDTTVLADGGTPPMEVWVRTNDGRKVPIGGFGEAVEFKPSWRGLGRSDHVDGIDAPLEGTNDRAIERWQRAREWTEWAAPIVPGLDQQDTALVHNLMAREFGLEDLGAWARKDMTILRALASLPSATLAAAGLSAKALKRGAGFEDEREIGETE